MLPQSVKFTKNNIEVIIDIYGNTLFKICLLILCNDYDAEFAIQEVIIRYINKSPTFYDAEHEKEWLITIAINCCKNIGWFNFKSSQMKTGDLELYAKYEENYGLLEILMKLPRRYKVVLLLYYVEGYKIYEVAEMLKVSESSAKRRLDRVKELIAERYGNGKYVDIDKIKNAVNDIEMSKVMRYRIKNYYILDKGNTI